NRHWTCPFFHHFCQPLELTTLNLKLETLNVAKPFWGVFVATLNLELGNIEASRRCFKPPQGSIYTSPSSTNPSIHYPTSAPLLLPRPVRRVRAVSPGSRFQHRDR